MKIVVTGSSGFVGRTLVRRLLAQNGLGGGAPALTRLTLVDMNVDAPSDPRVKKAEGSIVDAAVRGRALEGGADVLFHLASIPGGAAEENYELGYAVNVQATFALFEALKDISPSSRVVFTSSIAVLGNPLPERVDDDTLPQPTLSYGAQKLMAEPYLTDMSRRGLLDARAVRLPGIIARPRAPAGHISAFMSEIFHALPKGERFMCPVSEGATMWLMSVERCVDNLIHAALVKGEVLPAYRGWTLPALRLSMADLVDSLANRFGNDVRKLVTWKPVKDVEERFGAYPPLTTTVADRMKFHHDGTADAMIQRVLSGIESGIS